MRIQLEMTKQHYEDFKKLKKLSGIRQHKELLNSALSFFKWAIREVESGRIIASVDEKNEKYKEVVIPAFDFVRGEKSDE